MSFQACMTSKASHTSRYHNTMSELYESDQAALVRRFSHDVLEAVESPDESQDFSQLRADLIEDVKKRSEETHAKIKAIEDQFRATGPDDEILFARTRQELLQAIKEFQKYAPDQSLPTDQPWQWADVESAVGSVRAQWAQKSKESHVSRAMECLRKMCGGLHNHSALLKMIPSENNYTSLICGAVTMVVKASANYTSVIEAFANGVLEINDAVAGIQTQIYDSPTLQRLVMRLYAQVFSYLRKFMKWFTDRSRTRFLKSFNENLGQSFQDDLQKVKNTCTALSRQVQNHISAEVKATKLLVQNLNTNMEHLVTLYEASSSSSRDTSIRDAADAELMQNMLNNLYQKTPAAVGQSQSQMMLKYYQRLRKEISGASMRNLLMQQVVEAADESCGQSHVDKTGTFHAGTSMAHHHIDDRKESQISRRVPPGDDGSDDLEHHHHHYRGLDGKLRTTHFEDVFDWDKVYPFPDTGPPEDAEVLLTDRLVVTRLDAFTTSMASQVLYLHDESFATDHPNFLQQAMGAYIALARDQCIPVVSYFCRLAHTRPKGAMAASASSSSSSSDSPSLSPKRTRESVELCAALYAMLRQLINLLPADFTTTTTSGRGSSCSSRGEAVAAAASLFTEDGLKGLDGTLRTWDRAVDLFAELVRCLKLPLLLFVVDGINLVEDDMDRYTLAKIDRLVCRLRSLVEEGQAAQAQRKGEEEEEEEGSLTTTTSIVKVLFSTAGLSRVLCSRLEEADSMNCREIASPRNPRARFKLRHSY